LAAPELLAVKAPGIIGAELDPPAPDGFIRDSDPAFQSSTSLKLNGNL
jgi:hypothetical protein